MNRLRPSGDVVGGLLRSLETDQVSRLVTKEQDALLLPVPWDRSLGKSLVSVARRVPVGDLQGNGRCGGEGAASLSHKNILSGNKILGEILDLSFSSHSCIRVAMTPGVLVEGVEGMGGGWLRPQLPAPVPPDSPSPAE